MLQILLKGIILGFSLSLMIGPVFFILISTSINKGKTIANYLALGIAISDALLITLAVLGISFLKSKLPETNNSQLISAIILISFGIYTALKKPKTTSEKDIKVETKEKFKNIAKGFIINVFNPSVIIFWVAAIGTVLSKNQFTNQELSIFLLGVVLTTFIIDLLKVKLADLFSKLMTAAFIAKLNYFIGGSLIFSGVWFLIKCMMLK